MRPLSEFQKLLAASFISQTGSHFLTLALASFVMATTGSLIQSSLVFIFSFLPAVFLSARLGGWIDRRIGRSVLIGNDITASILSLVCGICIATQAPLAILGLALAARSILLFVSRSGYMKWIKAISPPEIQDVQIKLYFLTFFLSTAISGLMAGWVLRYGSIWNVVGIDLLTYFLSIGCLLFLRPIRIASEVFPQPERSLGPVETMQQILSTKDLRESFLSVCLSQALFQGAYQVLVTYLPMTKLGLGLGGIGPFQLAASLGIIGGFIVNWKKPELLSEKSSRLPIRLIGAVSLAILALIICSRDVPFSTSLTAFFALNLFFECTWLYHSAAFFRSSPKESLGRYQFALTAIASFSTALFTLVYAVAIEQFGLEIGILSTLGLAALLLVLGIINLVARKQVTPATEGVSS